MVRVVSMFCLLSWELASASLPHMGDTALLNYWTCWTNDIYNLTANDYFRARMRHWLQDTNDLSLSGYLSVERDPSPDGSTEGLKTFYDYQGKTYPHRSGTNALPSVVAWRLPNG